MGVGGLGAMKHTSQTTSTKCVFCIHCCIHLVLSNIFHFKFQVTLRAHWDQTKQQLQPPLLPPHPHPSETQHVALFLFILQLRKQRKWLFHNWMSTFFFFKINYVKMLWSKFVIVMPLEFVLFCLATDHKHTIKLNVCFFPLTEKWITIALGWITVLGNSIKSTLSYSQ